MALNEDRSTWTVALTSAIRAAFGIVWAIAAYLTWRPEFADHYVGYLQNAAQGQPDWIKPWFDAWLAVVGPRPDLFIWLTRAVETAVAIGLLFGLARKLTYLVGGLFSLLVWATAGGFGGPYAVGATNPGPSLVYVLVFAALSVLNWAEGRTPYSLDFYLERAWPGWRALAEWAPRPRLALAPRPLPWPEQVAAIGVIAAALVLSLVFLGSALTVSAATPTNAAAAVSPLSLASAAPIAGLRDATLPPLIGTGDSVAVTLTATDTQVEIASGVNYDAWTFNGIVPAPILHVRQGQTINVTFINQGMAQHSIDFHAAEVAPSVDYRSISPGERIQFSFVATTPGVFMYHCGTAPVLLHIGNGMYGAIVVDPQQPLPAADVSYVLVESEWYTRQVAGNLMGGDFAKMQAATPDEVVFNGAAFQYRDHPLAAHAGQRVRLYLVNAGPSLWSAFHIIGGIFNAVYPDGVTAHALNGVSTYPVGPGEGVVLDAILPQPGDYTFLNHSMRSAQMGAVGVLHVTP